MCTDITFLPEHLPSVRLSGKTNCSMTGVSRGNGKTRSKKDAYLLKLKAVGFDNNPYTLPAMILQTAKSYRKENQINCHNSQKQLESRH